MGLVLFVFGTMLAQRQITGTVSDQQTGEPLIGASILVEGTSTGTVTDIDGSFTIDLPEGSNQLVISYTGYESQTVTVGASNTIDISLAQGVVLEDIVVTAVGLEANRRSLGYSVENVEADEVIGSREVNLVSALNAKVAGVNVTSAAGSPGASARITIRGATSIGRTNSPLFVVDGVPISNDNPGNGVGGVDRSNRAIDINPNDIASISVLKGASATALYGVRAANGAIIITTKKGETGKPTVTFNASYGLDEINKFPELQTEYAQGQPSNGVLIWRGPHTGEGFSWGPRIADLEFSNDPNHPNAPPANTFDAQGNYLFDRNGFLVPRGTGSGLPAQAYSRENYFKTGSTYDINFSISGGTERTRYFFSAGRLDQEGTAPNSTFARNSLKLTTDFQITDKLSAAVSGNYVNSGGNRLQRGSNVQGIMLGLLRTTPTFDNGNGKSGQEAADDPSSYVLPNGAQRSYRAGVYDSPYWVSNRNPFNDVVNRLIGYTSFKLEALPWLAFQYKLGIDTYSEEYLSADDVNFRFDGATIRPGGVTNFNRTRRDVNSDFLVLITKQLNEDIGINATVGHNYYDTRNVTRSTVGNTLGAPTFFHISNVSTVNGSEGIGEKKLIGAFGTVDLNYRDYLFLNLTGRNDWSSALPEDDNTFQSYSASLGFAFTELLQMQTNPIFSYGKLRFSYGIVGNDAPIYATLNYFGQSTAGGDGFITGVEFPGFGTNAFERNAVLGNNLLVPEETSTLEIGAEFKFLRGRLGFDFTYFDQESRDQIIAVDVSAATGFTSVVQNAGTITSEGVEILFTATPVQGPNFSWEIDANFTAIENEVKELAEGIENITLAGFTSTSSRVVVGEPYGAIFGNAFQRNEDGLLVIGANGFPLQAPSDQVVGDPNPDFTMGIRNTFTVLKNIRLSALLDIREGGDMWCGTCGIIDYFGTSQLSGDTRDQTITFEGVSAADGTPITSTVPYFDPAAGLGAAYFVRYGFGGLSEPNIFDTSWFRLREVSASYTFPQSITQKLPFKNLVLTFTGRNLWLDTDFPGIDPETNLTGASNGFGLEYFNNPNTKSYNFSLKAIF